MPDCNNPEFTSALIDFVRGIPRPEHIEPPPFLGDEIVDLAATALTGLVMACGGILGVLARPTLFDEVHAAFVYGLTHPRTPDA